MADKKNDKEVSTKMKILEAAFILFSEKGIKDISMREIAQACAITKPVIYYYFKDKDDLCYEMVKNMTFSQNNKIEEFAKTSETFEVFLGKFFGNLFDSKKNKRIVSFMLHLYSYVASREQLLKRLKSIEHLGLKTIKRLSNEEVKKGRLPAGMREILAHLIMASTAHMIMHKEGECDLKFKSSYPKDMAKAILRAVEYKGEIK